MREVEKMANFSSLFKFLNEVSDGHLVLKPLLSNQLKVYPTLVMMGCDQVL